MSASRAAGTLTAAPFLVLNRMRAAASPAAGEIWR
jgi:hypothetical protein